MKSEDPLIRAKYGASYYAEIQAAEGTEKAQEIWAAANRRYQQLLQENRQLPEKVKAHTDQMIFPAIAAYQALLAADPAHAMQIMETAERRVSTKTGEQYARLVRSAFMRKLFLKIFSYGARKGFAEESGFVNHSVRDEKDDVAFRMEQCPYHDYCVKYSCPELAHIFCRNDIYTYGNLPGIVFERHETLGEGGTCCDFHLYLKQ